MDTSSLQLFYMPMCPYCLKVIAFLKLNNIKVMMVNINTSIEQAEYLIKYGGKRTVPCLKIENQFLYESNDIIQWFQKNIIK